MERILCKVSWLALTLYRARGAGGSAARRGGAVYRELCKPAGPARVPIHYSTFVVLGRIFLAWAPPTGGTEGTCPTQYLFLLFNITPKGAARK